MKFKEMISQKAFWKSVLFLGLGFLIVYDVVSMLFEYGGFHFEAYFTERTEDGKLFRFIVGQFLAAFVYGFIISFGQFRARKKKDAEN
ncbi:hypothetical protein ACWBC2_01365 [Salegentibacter agarivorans]|uniref:hypothetical protein n=1 Tax=Salegentibacter sp. BDJ18 TaxID=2816376 RepID=UPI001AAF8747|nr:hypothetical protein [Salegentibacter sp. BDJ18]MBO2542898.1 hypothetical protein [Salegentibacter sp. BDJ18]